MNKTSLIAGATVLMVLLLAWAIWNSGTAPASGFGSEAGKLSSGGQSEIQLLQRRLEEMDRAQMQRLAILERRLDKLSGVAPTPTPAQLAAKQQAEEHERRMREDPVYARKAKLEEIAQLDANFKTEPVNRGWATVARLDVDDALRTVDVPIDVKSVECRSSSCKVQLALSASDSDDDVLLHLMTGLAQTVPHSRIVHLPSVDGRVRELHIYAKREDPKTTPLMD